MAASALHGKKLGILVSAAPSEPGFRHGLRLAETAVERGVEVYLYCVDEAVRGAEAAELQALAKHGLKLYVCAYGGQKRNVPRNAETHYAGLALLSDLVAAVDRFVSFN